MEVNSESHSLAFIEAYLVFRSYGKPTGMTISLGPTLGVVGFPVNKLSLLSYYLLEFAVAV